MWSFRQLRRDIVSSAIWDKLLSPWVGAAVATVISFVTAMWVQINQLPGPIQILLFLGILFLSILVSALVLFIISRLRKWWTRNNEQSQPSLLLSHEDKQKLQVLFRTNVQHIRDVVVIVVGSVVGELMMSSDQREVALGELVNQCVIGQFHEEYTKIWQACEAGNREGPSIELFASFLDKYFICLEWTRRLRQLDALSPASMGQYAKWREEHMRFFDKMRDVFAEEVFTPLRRKVEAVGINYGWPE